MNVVDAPFAGAAALLRTDEEVDAGYRFLLRVLEDTSVPRQKKVKASPRFIYDQTLLQASIRSQMRIAGWTHGDALSGDWEYEGVRFPGIQADLIGSGLQVILEFGNRASWAHNLVTRAAAGTANGRSRLTVFVAPRDDLADQMDTNLATFERIAGGLTLLLKWAPTMVPGPVMVVGVREG